MKRSLIMLSAVLLLLTGCAGLHSAREESTFDPYAGMVEVDNGAGGRMWVTKYENLSVNPYAGLTEEEIIQRGGILSKGIDVSEHQGDINWNAVAASDIRFAIIRAGYRGYGESGILCEDANFRSNFEGACQSGIAVGVYFFSQATDSVEAVEEAEFLLELLKEVPSDKCELPIFFDWENITIDNARTDGIGGGIMTECAVAFCKRIEEAGFIPGIYAYRSLAYHYYDLPSLQPFVLWIGALGERSDFYYAHEFWQYGIHESIEGIETEVDIDYRFLLPTNSNTENE